MPQPKPLGTGPARVRKPRAPRKKAEPVEAEATSEPEAADTDV